MPQLTLRFGLVLILLGAAFFALSATSEHLAPTSLIPAVFGLLLVGLGLAARTEDSKRRMLFMHIAVTVGLIGFLFPFARSIKGTLALLSGGSVAHPRAVEESMLMALVCLVFTALCVRSFISARRTRLA